MAIRERFQYAVELIADSAPVKKFTAELSAAQGPINKFKVAGSAAMTQIKAHAGELAMAGGAALVTFGVKAVGAFKDLALESDKFAKATGQSVEDASRWIEVAGDIGIGTEQIQSAFVRMEKAAAQNKGAFADLGAEIARTQDGQVDVTQTFLNTVEALQQIPDANQRAKASSEIFGRGYAEVAELINTDAASIRDSLNAVSDAKVIDEAEVEKAKRLRAALDSLQDTIDDVTLLVGESLIPVVSEAGEKLQTIADGVTDIKQAYEGLPEPIRAAAEAQARLIAGDPKGAFDAMTGAASDTVFALNEFEGSAEDLRTELSRLGASEEAIEAALAAYAKQQDEATGVTEDASEATGTHSGILSHMIGVLADWRSGIVAGVSAVKESNWFLRKQADEAAAASAEIDGLRESHTELRAELADQSAYLDLQDAFDGVTAAAKEAYTAAAEGSEDAEAKARDFERAQIDLKQRVLDYTDAIGNVPEETTSRIIAFIDDGNLAAAEEALANLTRQRYADVLVRLSGVGSPTGDGGFKGGGGLVGRAAGGPLAAGQLAQVNERGHPEMFTDSTGRQYFLPAKAGQVTPLEPAAGATASATTPPGASIVSPGAIREAARRMLREEIERYFAEAH